MAAEVAQEQPRPAAPRPVRCIVKLGGAAITNKGELESINEENLRSACAQLRHAMSESDGDGATEKVLGMDWSRKPGDPADPAVDADWIAGMTGLGLDTNFIVVHGAEGIPSVGMSPFACGWSTQQRKLASANASQIIKSLHAGFVPVLHGDAVLDELLDCTILSGDVIIRHLAQLLTPKYVVFLLTEVDDNGGWSVVKPALLQGNTKGVEISVAAHDTTGGMETKILEAAVIARLGIDVYITKAGTEHSLRALKGDASTDSEDWLGTIIRSSK